jgi:hypothetical protein
MARTRVSSDASSEDIDRAMCAVDLPASKSHPRHRVLVFDEDQQRMLESREIRIHGRRASTPSLEKNDWLMIFAYLSNHIKGSRYYRQKRRIVQYRMVRSIRVDSFGFCLERQHLLIGNGVSNRWIDHFESLLHANLCIDFHMPQTNVFLRAKMAIGMSRGVMRLLVIRNKTMVIRTSFETVS